MKVAEVKEIAKQLGVKVSRQTKTNLIKQIQIAEGNFDCYATPVDGYCDQDGCTWRTDCLKAA